MSNNSSIITENLYLQKKNIKECKRILSKRDKSPDDIADFLISLHLVLEININALIREVVLNNLQKNIDKSKITEDLDGISFIHKTVFFICMQKYRFDFDEIKKADNFYDIIKTMKLFTNTRNQLLHGSMIGGFLDERSNDTHVVHKLTEKHMNEQIEGFKKIFQGMEFYLEHLSSKNNYDIKSLKNKFLNYSFLE